MTGAEHFWYILMCIGFGAGYFGKIPTAKSLSELPQFQSDRQGGLGTITSAATLVPRQRPSTRSSRLIALDTDRRADPERMSHSS
jgi:hypothetical protein